MEAMPHTFGQASEIEKPGLFYVAT